jgi:1-phosphofructokinase
MASTANEARVAVFGPHPLLTVTVEREGEGDAGRERIHFHAGGQGVWVARMAGELGAVPLLCGFIGGEAGELLAPLLEQLPGERRLVRTATDSGSYVTDRRSGERQVVAMSVSDAPSRHELDELFSLTVAEAIGCGWLAVCNPLPAEALPFELYGQLVADARAGGARVLVDLSSPRLDSALAGAPDVVKLNDWELAAYVRGPVAQPRQLLDAARRLLDAGAQRAIVTRGEQPGLVLDGDDAFTLRPPRLERGFREGCGDAMMGALAAALAQGTAFQEAVVLGAAAGAASFLRRGLGSASRDVVQQLVPAVALEPFAA